MFKAAKIRDVRSFDLDFFVTLKLCRSSHKVAMYVKVLSPNIFPLQTIRKETTEFAEGN